MTKQEFKTTIIQYYKKYYKLHNEAPSLKKVFEHFKKQKLYYAKFYDIFPGGQAEACKLAEIPIPEERLKQTRKARQTAKKKRLGETETSETQQIGRLDVFKQSLEKERKLRSLRKKEAEELAKAVKLVSFDPNPEINGPMLKALEKIVPRILKVRYGITLTFWGLKQLNEITGGDLSFEKVRKMAEYSKLSDEQKQALDDLVRKLDGMTLYEIAKYATLSGEDKEAIKILVTLSHSWKMTLMETVVRLDAERRFKEGGADLWLGGFGEGIERDKGKT